MPKYLFKEIDKMKEQLVALAKLVQDNLEKSLRSLAEMDESLANEVINNDVAIDRTEVDVEEECLKILALHQPVATDLRFIVGVLKINNDLERISDMAVNIAERTIHLLKFPPLEIPGDLRVMEEKVRWMVSACIQAFVRIDGKLAHKVLLADHTIDELNRSVYDQVKKKMHDDPDHLDAFIELLSVSRQLERAADHCTNIAEDVVYMLGGEIIRHKPR